MVSPAHDRDPSHSAREDRQPTLVGPQADVSKSHSALHDFSIVAGGPVYDFFLRIGIFRLGLPNVLRRIVALVALNWLPLLVLAELVIDPAIRRSVREFVENGLIQADGIQDFRAVLERVQRLRDSAIPELALLVI